MWQPNDITYPKTPKASEIAREERLALSRSIGDAGRRKHARLEARFASNLDITEKDVIELTVDPEWARARIASRRRLQLRQCLNQTAQKVREIMLADKPTQQLLGMRRGDDRYVALAILDTREHIPKSHERKKRRNLQTVKQERRQGFRKN